MVNVVDKKEFLRLWVSNKLQSDQGHMNPFKKEAIKTYNKIIIQMTLYLAEKPQVSEATIVKFIMQEFFASKTTAKNYIMRIKSQEVFQYDDDSLCFLLPDEINEQIKDLQ